MNIGEMILSFIYSYVACLAFTFIYNMRGKFIWLAPLGGAIGWLVYNAMSFTGKDILQYFVATVAIAIYSETMARIHKTPMTMFLIVALLPLVPGAGIYYTMDYCISGDQTAFGQSLVHTLAIAGSLSLGIVLVSSLFRLCTLYLRHRNSSLDKCR